ncbi:hypothetical protein [Williamsia deligens]|uniref:Uncharacterized protein n=1 Tax=Williamsia deligens TaxID=321325 RepID=A0ABW3G8P8_9NOCA|nr:hypothetical protein [Williamsia deligens]MCP2192389.1 hypothetical protein [Williamsia deligens]
MNPADQIEAIVARTRSTLDAVDRRHRVRRGEAESGWRSPDDDETGRGESDAAQDGDDANAQNVLSAEQAAAVSDAAGG